MLCAALRTGDAAAFAELYKMHGDLVFRIAQRILDDVASAEDIVQSVFLTLWKTPPMLTAGSFTSWLSFVTRNRVRDMLRARKARREAAWPEKLPANDTPHDEVCSRLQAVRVRQALAALPLKQRTLIELGFFSERSHVELAQIMQVPLGTVKTRIRAGLTALRSTLSEENRSENGLAS